MIFFERYVFVFFLFIGKNGARPSGGGVVANQNIYDNSFEKKINFNTSSILRSGDDVRWKNLEEEVFQELNQLNFRTQREIFEHLKRQQKEMNTSQKNLSSIELQSQSLSPLYIEELNNIRKVIKSSNNTLPTIRNKRTLNFLLFVVAKAMGFSLIPRNSNVQWLFQVKPPSLPLSLPPSSSTPPCRSSTSSSSSSPCFNPTTVSPCSNPSPSPLPPTIPPNQINADAISYPFRPAGTIPLFTFAPLPPGVTVPYPPLLQPPTTQPPLCAPTQTSSSPPCRTTSMPPPCTAMPTSVSPPCGNTTNPSSEPTKTPRQPCTTLAAAKSSQPCSQPLCGTSLPPSPPCAPSTPQSSPPVLLPTKKPPKNSIFLEYDDPVRIHIFSNEKKYLPASGSIYGGQEDDYKGKSHSYFFPRNEEIEDKEEEAEEKDRGEIEEKSYRFQDDEEDNDDSLEEEDERKNKSEGQHEQWGAYGFSQKEDDDESETNLSIVKKPLEQMQGKRRTSLTQPLAKNNTLYNRNYGNKGTLMEGEIFEKSARGKISKNPKGKKWVRIVKKQRRKMDSRPQEDFQINTSNISPESSFISREIYSQKETEHASPHGFNKDFDHFISQNFKTMPSYAELEKINVKNKGSPNPKILKRVRRYKGNETHYYATEVEDENRRKLEKAVERYIEGYIAKQLGHEILENSGIPKTTVFEFVPKSGPRIHTITTTVAKINHYSPQLNSKPQIKSKTFSGNFHMLGETEKLPPRKHNF